jgi:hypothetical protein
MANQKQGSAPSETEREPGTREDGEAMPPAAIDPGTDDRSKTKGIPPLPEPDVEGVGNESGPSADKNRPETEALSADKAKMVKDATGF